MEETSPSSAGRGWYTHGGDEAARRTQVPGPAPLTHLEFGLRIASTGSETRGVQGVFMAGFLLL